MVKRKWYNNQAALAAAPVSNSSYVPSFRMHQQFRKEDHHFIAGDIEGPSPESALQQCLSR